MRADLSDVGITSVRAQAELARLDLLPPWLGDERVHRSHRSALLRKDPDWYGRLFTDVPADLPCYWPDVALRSADGAGAEAST